MRDEQESRNLYDTATSCVYSGVLIIREVSCVIGMLVRTCLQKASLKVSLSFMQ